MIFFTILRMSSPRLRGRTPRGAQRFVPPPGDTRYRLCLTHSAAARRPCTEPCLQHPASRSLRTPDTAPPMPWQACEDSSREALRPSLTAPEPPYCLPLLACRSSRTRAQSLDRRQASTGRAYFGEARALPPARAIFCLDIKSEPVWRQPPRARASDAPARVTSHFSSQTHS